jgi:hypothetical protein
VPTPIHHEEFPEPEPASVLIIRVWWEPGAPQPLRARLVGVTHTGVVRNVGAVVNRDTILTAVGAWMDQFVSQVNDDNP